LTLQINKKLSRFIVLPELIQRSKHSADITKISYSNECVDVYVYPFSRNHLRNAFAILLFFKKNLPKLSAVTMYRVFMAPIPDEKFYMIFQPEIP